MNSTSHAKLAEADKDDVYLNGTRITRIFEIKILGMILSHVRTVQANQRYAMHTTINAWCKTYYTILHSNNLSIKMWRLPILSRLRPHMEY